MDKTALQHAARVTTDEGGNPVVQIPLALWEAILNAANDTPQYERIKNLLAMWQSETDDLPDKWWDAFEADLKSSRLNLSRDDLSLDHT